MKNMIKVLGINLKNKEKMNEHYFGIPLGREVKDVVTGVSGIVMARCEYATGCDQYLVQPTTKEAVETSKLPDSYWFDYARLVILKSKGIDINQIRSEKEDDNGCDYQSAPKK